MSLLWFSILLYFVRAQARHTWLEYPENRNSYIGECVSLHLGPFFFFSFFVPKLFLFLLLVAAYSQSLQETSSFVFSLMFLCFRMRTYWMLKKINCLARLFAALCRMRHGVLSSLLLCSIFFVCCVYLKVLLHTMNLATGSLLSNRRSSVLRWDDEYLRMILLFKPICSVGANVVVSREYQHDYCKTD